MKEYVKSRLTAYYNPILMAIAVPIGDSHEDYEVWRAYNTNYVRTNYINCPYQNGKVLVGWSELLKSDYIYMYKKLIKTPQLVEKLSLCWNVDTEEFNKVVLMGVI